MNTAQHASLCESISSFKLHFLSCLNNSYPSLGVDLTQWRDTVEERFKERLAKVEGVLAGPYNRELEWDWVPDDREFSEVAEFMRERKVRLRDGPMLEITGKEYFEKYARGGLGVLKVLESAGFYTPPATRFFQSFCKQLLEGSKTLLRLEELCPISIPLDQIDLAFNRAQELIATEHRLHRYCPLGIPMYPGDKNFYIQVVNSLAGLPYKVILPLSDWDQQCVKMIQKVVEEVGSAGVRVGEGAYELEKVLKKLAGEDLQASYFLELVASHRRRLLHLQSKIPS